MPLAEHTQELRRHIPNMLTLSRVAWAVLFFAVLSRWSYDRSPIASGAGPDWLLLSAALLFIIAALTDFLDGHLARRWNVVSVFGRIMDPFADKLLVLGGFILLAGPGFSTTRLFGVEPPVPSPAVPMGALQISGVLPWMAVVILGRELLVTSLRAAVESKGISFAAMASGKWKMVLQSTCIPLVLILLNVPITAGPWGDWPLLAIKVLVWSTVVVTAWSGVPYLARALTALREDGVGGPPAHRGLTSMEELWITSFGLGHMRPFPGTWGSLPPVILALALVDAGRGPADSPWIFNGIMLAIVAGFFYVCAQLGPGAEDRFGKKDPGQVVADETAGQAMTLLFLPAASCATMPRAAISIAFAFVAFRVLDILKPFPAYRIQKLPGGWGVVMDDLTSAAYALLATQLFTRVIF